MSGTVGGSFLPAADYDIAGTWNFQNTPTFGTAGGSGFVVTTSGTQTLTNKTLTTPTITTPTVTGGTLTTPTLVTPVINTIKGAFSTGTVTPYATDTYQVGSAIAIPTGGFLAGARYWCKFDMTKTAAGTATPIAVVRIGTAGTTSDAAILTFTFAAGTAAVDTGTFEITAHFRTIGSGTSAVMVGLCECRHALAATGLVSTGASGNGLLSVVSSGFDSTIAATTIGVSFNGGASFAGTCTLVEAELKSYLL